VNVLLSRLPIPPALNNQYVNNPKTGGRFPSRELKDFKKAVEVWRLENLKLVASAKAALIARVPTQQKPIRIDRYFAFRGGRLIALNGLPKRMDVSNRVKGIDDAIADVLGIDDCWFFGGSEEKVMVDSEAEEGVTLVLTLMGRPYRMSELMAFDGGVPHIVNAQRLAEGARFRHCCAVADILVPAEYWDEPFAATGPAGSA
jgi:hypothetical protein